MTDDPLPVPPTDPLRREILASLRTDPSWWTARGVRGSLPIHALASEAVVRRCLNVMAHEGLIERANEKEINPMHTGRATVFRVRP